jgi:hypothetical protein
MGDKRDRRGGKGFGDESEERFQGVPSSASDAIDEDSIPVNLGAVRADDDFIEALLEKRVVPAQSPVDHELAALLSNWRAELIDRPMPVGPSLADVEAGIAAQRRAGSRRRSLMVARYTAGAAAACAILFGGVSVMAHDASPGDPLWGVKEVMFGADASATLAAGDVENDLDHAVDLLSTGDRSAAQNYLNRAESQLADIGDADRRAELQAKIDQLRGLLTAILPTTPPTQTVTMPPAETTLPPLLLPPVTITQTQQTVTIIPTETTSVSTPPPSTDETVTSEPPVSESSTTTSTSVPLPPAG